MSESTMSVDVRAAVAEMVGVSPAEIPDDANLVHLGLGSLEAMRLVNRWRRQGLPVSFRDLVAEPTVAAWQRHLDTAGKPEASA